MNANKQDAGGLPTATKDGDIFGPDGAVVLAAKFHDAYERLAPSFGYETRIETRLFDPDTANGRLMTAVCREILGEQCRAASVAPAEIESMIERLAAEASACITVLGRAPEASDVRVMLDAAKLLRALSRGVPEGE